MPDLTVVQLQNLPEATALGENDTLVAEQGGVAKRLAASLFKGEKGDPGADGTMTFDDLTPAQKATLKGDPGPAGPAGASPTITVERIADGVNVTVHNVDGTEQTAIIADGAVGDMATIAVAATTLAAGSAATAEITAGTNTDYLITFGIPKGQDGTVTFDELTPEQQASLKGDAGPKGDAFTYADFTAAQLEALRGPQGVAGLGVPSGGTTGQVLAKRSATDNDTEWVTPETSWQGTQAQYDALADHTSYDNYYIVEAAT